MLDKSTSHNPILFPLNHSICFIQICVCVFIIAQQPYAEPGLDIGEVSTSHSRHTSLGSTPLKEWEARRRDHYLTTHKTQKRQISMPPAGFEPAISASERSQNPHLRPRCQQDRLCIPLYTIILPKNAHQCILILLLISFYKFCVFILCILPPWRWAHGWPKHVGGHCIYKLNSIHYNFFMLLIPCIFIQGVSRLVHITAGGDFLGLCDQKSSYKHVSDFWRLRSYGHFLIPVHALVWTASYETSWRGYVLSLVAYPLRKLRRATRAVHNRAAACVAAGGGIFENQL